MVWNTMQMALVGCYGIALVLIAYLILSAIHYIWILDNPIKLKTVKGLSFWGLSLFAFVCMIRFGETLFFYEDDPKHNLIKAICEASALLFWSTAQCCSYLLFAQRLKMLFIHTKYQYNKNVFVILYLLIFLFWISLLGNVILAQCYYNDIMSGNLYLLISDINSLIASVVDLILTVILIYLFTKKLFQLSIDITLSKQKPRYSMTSLNSGTVSHISLNSATISVIHVVAKFTILSIMAVVSTQIFFIFYDVLYLYYIITRSDHIYNVMFDIYLILWWFAIVINSLTIYLNLDATILIYQIFCLRIHNWVQHCCTLIAKRKIKHQKVRKVSLHISHKRTATDEQIHEHMIENDIKDNHNKNQKLLGNSDSQLYINNI